MWERRGYRRFTSAHTSGFYIQDHGLYLLLGWCWNKVNTLPRVSVPLESWVFGGEVLRTSVAISENRILPGHVLQLSIWQGAGMPKHDSCSLWQSFSSFEGPSGNSYPRLCSWVCAVGLKARRMSLKFNFETPLIFAPECVSKGSSPSCGREWARSSGNGRGWKCICSLQCRVGWRGWDRQGRDVQGLFTGWGGRGHLFLRESSCHPHSCSWVRLMWKKMEFAWGQM